MDANALTLLLNLISKSSEHLNYPFRVIQVNFLSSLEIGNYRLYMHNGEVRGFVNWTFLTFDEMTFLIKAGGVMHKNSWRTRKFNDSHLFIPEIIAIGNTFSAIQVDLENIFPSEGFAYGLSWRRTLNPRIRKVRNRIFTPPRSLP